MKFISLLTFLLLQVTFAVASEYSAPVVKANGEELLGEWTDTAEQIAVFKGIPFARPPAGELRWRTPQPHLPRAGRHDSWLPTDETDQALTGAILDYWVQFARTGDPNLAGRPAWPVHSRQDPAVMELGNRIGAMEAFSTELCKMLNPAWR